MPTVRRWEWITLHGPRIYFGGFARLGALFMGAHNSKDARSGSLIVKTAIDVWLLGSEDRPDYRSRFQCVSKQGTLS